LDESFRIGVLSRASFVLLEQFSKHWTAKTALAAFTFLVAPCIDWLTRDEHVGLSGRTSAIRPGGLG
jgi:hypothetical protein